MPERRQSPIDRPAVDSTDPTCETADRHERFVVLFVRHQPAIHSFVLTLLPDLAEAEEIVQQASLTMWRRFDQYEAGTSFRNWAFQIAKYTAFNHLTKLRRDRHVFSTRLLELLAERAVERSDDLDSQRQALAFCIGRLSDDERRLLATRYSEEATVKGLAEQLGRTSNSVYKQLDRIRMALLRCVRERLGVEGAR